MAKAGVPLESQWLQGKLLQLASTAGDDEWRLIVHSSRLHQALEDGRLAAGDLWRALVELAVNGKLSFEAGSASKRLLQLTDGVVAPSTEESVGQLVARLWQGWIGYTIDLPRAKSLGQMMLRLLEAHEVAALVAFMRGNESEIMFVLGCQLAK